MNRFWLALWYVVAAITIIVTIPVAFVLEVAYAIRAELTGRALPADGLAVRPRDHHRRMP